MTQTYRVPPTKEDRMNTLRGVGLTDDEVRLLVAPVSTLIKDKALAAKADKAWEKRNTLIRKSNEEQDKKAVKTTKFSAPAVHTYETQ